MRLLEGEGGERRGQKRRFEKIGHRRHILEVDLLACCI
jgi:hypothetical protein